MGEARKAGVTFRDRIGTPLHRDAAKLLLLGSGELGREVALEAMRLGAEVIAVDRYPHAPAMQVAHRSHVLAMTDGPGLRALVEREAPDVIVPEIEQIDTEELVRLEEDGWTVIPRAEATRTTMDRERIRRLAAEKARVPTTGFAFADSAEETARAARDLGFPCVVKALVSSSGHGMSVVRDPAGVAEAYRSASQAGRVPRARVMIERFLPFDLEVTLLTLRHFGPDGILTTSFLPPIGHARPGTLYHESWQPAELPEGLGTELDRIAGAVTGQLGGVGLFGVECFVQGTRVYFSEVSPRPHDTGLVTLASQWNSEFALHARAILGLPYAGPEIAVPSAAHVILGEAEGWAPSFGGLSSALARPEVRVHLFGKPRAYPERRLGVALARGADVTAARAAAEAAAHRIEAGIVLQRPGGARAHRSPA